MGDALCDCILVFLSGQQSTIRLQALSFGFSVRRKNADDYGRSNPNE